jgi:type I restriction enzyme S subunit
MVVAQIDAALTWIDRIAKEHDNASRLVHRLDQSVLAKAFRGELIPQDPNDEPASFLLERIRAERADQSKVKRRREGVRSPLS